MLKNEWKKLFQNKFMIVVMIAIILIPTIYTAIFVGAMWDPYGRVEHLPVAVVNKDVPVTYKDKELSVGEDLVKNLKENNSLDFNFVDADTAAAGLANGTYYMVLTIPKDFSKNATTLTEKNAKKMMLYYETNPGQNYIASKMSETAVSKIQTNIREKITTQYTETVFEQLGTIGDGFVEAADGALQITDGTDQLLDGNGQLQDGIETLKDGTVALEDGSTSLQTGISAYTQGVGTLKAGADTLNGKSSDLNGGVTSVSEGVTSLKSGSGAILAGMNTMSDELAKSLSKENMKNMEALRGGLTSINKGIQTLNTELQKMDVEGQLNTTVSAVTGGLTSIQGSLLNSQTHMGELQTAIGTLKMQLLASGKTEDEVNAMLLPLMQSAQAVGGDVSAIATTTSGLADSLKNSNLSEVTQKVDTLKSNVSTLAENSDVVLPNSSTTIEKLTSGLQGVQSALDKTGETADQMGLIQAMGAVNTGLGQLDTGINGEKGLKAGVKAYTDGVSQLAGGAEQLTANSAALNEGAGKLTSGAAALKDGSNRLYDGTVSMQEGLSKLKDGSVTLADSLNDAGDEVKATNTDEDTVEMFAAPVETKGSTYSRIDNNGSAMAAYMMGVGLWVACIAFCVMYPLMKPAGEVKNGIRWWFSKASVYLIIASVQAVVMVLMLKLILGFQPEYLGRTILVAMVASMAFMSVMYFFNICFDKVGSYLMLIFMVLQLGGSAGTYPLELSSDFYHKIHERMPFTYSVKAFRSTISTGQDISGEMAVFIGMIVVFNLLSLAVFVYKTKKGKNMISAEAAVES